MPMLSNRFQLAWIDPRPAEHAMDQARYIADLFHDYDVDYAVGDWGYGQDKIPLIQGGGRDSMDNKFLGIGQHKFMGCQTLGNEIKQNADFNEKYDEEGNEDTVGVGGRGAGSTAKSMRKVTCTNRHTNCMRQPTTRPSTCQHQKTHRILAWPVSAKLRKLRPGSEVWEAPLDVGFVKNYVLRCICS